MASDDFKRIFESLRVAVVIADAKGIVGYANSAFGQLASQDARSMAGVDLATLFAAEDRKRLQQNVTRVGEGKAGSAFFDAMLTPKDRTPHWVSVALQPSLDAKDKAAGVVAILQDIGSQRETDEALMTGTSPEDPHRVSTGNRVSTTFVLPRLDAYHLGALLAIYEHKVFVQASTWGINPFDQFGVELGKTIASKILPAVRGGEAALHPATHHLLGVVKKLSKSP